MRYIPGQPELGQSPKGFDCSGFVKYVLEQAGLCIPEFVGQDGRLRPIRHANELWDQYGVFIHEEVKLPGDIVVFSRNGLFPTHVGIMRDEKSYVHAPGTHDTSVEVKPLLNEPLAARGVGRLLYVRNPIGYKSPTVPIEQPTYRYHQRQI